MRLPEPGEIAARFAALPAAAVLLSAVADRGVDVYLVGGAVRDLYLGGAPLDLDLVVVGELDGLLAALGGPARGYARFGTATVSGPGGARYDLVRARRETYSEPGALPQVEPAGIGEDLMRRDFTVNAIALGLAGAAAGRLLTVEHGAEDLADGVLRVLHRASFRDDPTRLLRLARYEARLGFAVETETARLARAAIDDGALTTVSGPRIAAELALLAAEDDPVAGFAALRALGLDAAVARALGVDATAASRFGIADGGLARRALAGLPAEGDRLALLLGLAGRPIGLEGLRGLLDRLGVTAPQRRAALAVAVVDEIADALERAVRPSQVAAVLDGRPVEAVALAGALGSPAAATRTREWLAAWRHTGPGIGGDDLLAAGIPAGPAIAAGLRAARAARLDGEATTREAELAVALRAAGAVDG